MCGIVGIVHRDRRQPVSVDVVRSMCDAIRHRGPDEEGLYVTGPVGLGMRRLAIIDLSGGQQPIFNEDRSKVIVYNGEIYNYRDLRHGLVARGHTMRTHSDTETVLHLYEEEGAACVEPLRGMFAWAIWDETKQRLTLARDRFGIKPLYVVEASWGLAFASELKALLAVGLSNRELDWNALDSYLQLGYIPAPMSPFSDVTKLPPGHVLEWEPQTGATIRRYWDLPRSSVPASPTVEADVLRVLDESVAAHLESDVPVAAFLSGGLDSSAVVASMALAGETPHAFTARYHGTNAGATDESDLARLLANRYGAKLTVVDIHPDVATIFEPIVRALDEPQADDSAIPSWLIAEAVAGSYKVALSGTGGDEAFVGYRRHIGMVLGDLGRRLPRPLWQFASAVANTLPEPRDSSLGIDRLKRFLRSSDESAPRRYLGYLSKLPDATRSNLYAPELRQAISGDRARSVFEAHYETAGSPAGVRAALYLDYHVYLPDDLLMLSDRLSMAHSLEVRVPFVDHRVVETIYPLPDRTKMGVGRSKHLLRRALRGRLPADHFRAPKRGFVGPTGSWLRNELRGLLTDELSHARLTRLGWFDPNQVASLLTDHFEHRHNREGILWALLCLSTWHRLYLEQPAPPSYTSRLHAAVPD